MNYFYDLPDDIKDKIYFEVHKSNMEKVFCEDNWLDFIREGGWINFLSYHGFRPFDSRPTNSRLIGCEYDDIQQEYIDAGLIHIDTNEEYDDDEILLSQSPTNKQIYRYCLNLHFSRVLI